MRIIVFSDTHGSFKAADKIFRTNPDSHVFIFLGDGERELEMIREKYPDKQILNVRGNCDFYSTAPDFGSFCFEDVKILFTHGHTAGVKYSLDRLLDAARESGASIALFGHTHTRFCSYENGVYLLNPGSASMPRDGKPPSCGYIDLTSSGIVCGHLNL